MTVDTESAAVGADAERPVKKEERKKLDVARSHFAGKHRKLFETERWGVLLNKNQSYLGRSIVYLKQRLLENPLELTQAERDELWQKVMPRLASALEGAFGPDRLNYSHLGNRTRLVHWHVVPRYEREPMRQFAGRTFRDTRQGQNFRARKRDRLRKSELKLIAREVKAHLPPKNPPVSDGVGGGNACAGGNGSGSTPASRRVARGNGSGSASSARPPSG